MSDKGDFGVPEMLVLLLLLGWVLVVSYKVQRIQHAILSGQIQVQCK